jgi:hypothetical protein
MQKFSEFVNEHKASIAAKSKADAALKFNELYEAKLKEFGASSPLDLSEEQSKVFFEYLQNLKEAEMSKADVKKMVKDETKDLEKKVEKAEAKAEAAEKDADKAKSKAGQEEITDEKSFREYAEGVLRKAHPKDFDEKIADKLIGDLVADVKKKGDDDWGAAIGRLTSGLGQ